MAPASLPPAGVALSDRARLFLRHSATSAQFARFTVMGGLANVLYLVIVLSGTGAGGDARILNAVGLVSSTVLANELHRRYTFGAAGRGAGLAVHLAGSGTAVAGLAASTAALAGYQLALPQGPSWGTAAVGLTVSVAVGLARFLVLRRVSTREVLVLP